MKGVHLFQGPYDFAALQPFVLGDVKSNSFHLFESAQMSYEVGPLPVITVVITPISRVFSPQLPTYFRPFIGVRSPFINGSGAHLVQDHYRIGLVRLWLSTWQGQPSEAHTAMGGFGDGWQEGLRI